METNTSKNFWKNAWAILSFALVIVGAFFLFVYLGAAGSQLIKGNNFLAIIVSFAWFVLWTCFIFVWALRLLCSIKTYKETGKFNTFFVPAKKDKESRGI